MPLKLWITSQCSRPRLAVLASAADRSVGRTEEIVNALRTIQASEECDWVQSLFRRDVPAYPPTFPFPFRIRRRIYGGFLYVVYNRQVYAYGKILEVVSHGGARVGTRGQPVGPGDMIVLAGVMRPFPFPLECRGFRRIRYTEADLHKLAPAAARSHIRSLDLAIR